MSRNIELRHLRYFVALAEELHFGRAALRCNVSQPPFSVAIQQLERELGFLLVDRGQAPLRLTAAGVVYYEEALKILVQLQQAGESAYRIDQGCVGVLRVGFFASMLKRGLPLVLATMQTKQPALEIQLVELATREQILGVQKGTIDYGFVHTSQVPTGVVCEYLLKEPFVLCVPNRHPRSQEKTVHLADFSDEEFIIFARAVSPTYYDQITALCANAGFHPFVRHEVRHWLTAIASVAEGFGVALVPLSMRNTQSNQVAFLEILPSQIESSLWGVYREEMSDHAGLLEFRQVVLASLHS